MSFQNNVEDFQSIVNQDIAIGSNYIVVKKEIFDIFFPKIGDYYRAVCLNNGVIAPKCKNNIDSLCIMECIERPRDFYHVWDGKNCWKCPCG